MLTFLIRSLLFSVTLVTLYGGAAFWVRQETDFEGHTAMIYRRAMHKKHMRALQFDQPALLLMGGSSLSFGTNSKIIEEELHVPVVNLGLHGGLGVDWMMAELCQVADSGDLVLLSIEYYLGEGDYKLHSYFAEDSLFKSLIDPQPYKKLDFNFSLVNRKPIEEIRIHLAETKEHLEYWWVEAMEIELKNLSPRMQKPLLGPHPDFNKWGDIILPNGHKTFYQPPAEHARVPNKGVWSGIKKLNAFAEFAKEHHIEVIFMYPPYAKSNYTLHKKVIDTYHQTNLEKLKIEMLGAPEDFAYPDWGFYDTEYHLNRYGQEYRTKVIVEMLQSNERTAAHLKEMAALYTNFPPASTQADSSVASTPAH